VVTGRRAQKGLSVLADEFGPDCEFQQWRWRSDMLHDPQLQNVAARDVAEADFVILSIRGDWPLEVGALLDAWLVVKERRDVVLMAVFDDTNALEVGAGVPALSRLARLAGRKGLDFFEQVIGDPENRHGRGLKLAWVL
jgi:hypothetical protein